MPTAAAPTSTSSSPSRSSVIAGRDDPRHRAGARAHAGSTRAANSEILPLAIAFACWCLPQIFFYGLYTLLGEVLNARRSLRAVHLGARAQQRGRAHRPRRVRACSSASTPTAPASATTGPPGMVALLAGSATLGIVVPGPRAVLVLAAHRPALPPRLPLARRRPRCRGADGRLDVRHAPAHHVRRHRADPGRAAGLRHRRRLGRRDRQRVAHLHAAALGHHGLDRDRVLHPHERARARRRPRPRARRPLQRGARGQRHPGAGRRGAHGRRLPVRGGIPAGARAVVGARQRDHRLRDRTRGRSASCSSCSARSTRSATPARRSSSPCSRSMRVHRSAPSAASCCPSSGSPSASRS